MNGMTTRCASRRCRASACCSAVGWSSGYRPDVVHAHDWQAGLVPAYLHYDGAIATATVMTIHNLAFQGQFPSYLLGASRAAGQCVRDQWRRILWFHWLPEGGRAVRRPDHHGIANLCGGDSHAGARYGHGWAAACSRRRAGGDPQRHRHLGVGPGARSVSRQRFDADRLGDRAANKVALQTQFGLRTDTGTPLFGVISRLAAQKGIDLLLAGAALAARRWRQLVVLGSGEASLEAGCVRRRRARRIWVRYRLR